MLRHAAAAVVAVALSITGLVSVAHAADDPSANPQCGNSQILVTVCASDPGDARGSKGGSGSGAKPGADTAGSSSDSGDDCTYTKLVPQPPSENLAVQEGKRRSGKGAAYQVMCPSTGRIGVVWISDGQDAPAAPQIDPEVLARQAVDSMKLVGPEIANPRADGTYVVGMPMWMWVDQTPTTYGPNSATAMAGGVSVTAEAKVTSIRWEMGDGSAAVVCNGPGTKYRPSMGTTPSPNCGHVYEKVATSQDGKFHGTATATWTVNWEVTAGPIDAGSFTEVRQSPFTVSVHEVQVVR